MEGGPDRPVAERRPRDGRAGDFQPAGRPSRSRLLALFLLGMVLFNPPLLDAFDRPAAALGLPAILLYIFAVWLAVVTLVALCLERRR